ncbi:DUF427 domain-containing protein [Kribbella sp. NPDC051770]|uniref:DUF427 domain-containing protein n=1 Tax=Kribbella sp. NPDC051770 TaxID=3155413 RepID=UPI00344424AD
MERVVPNPGQESVWDYPRPPRLEPSTEHLIVTYGGRAIAETSRSWRVLETSHPPTYYLPRSAFVDGSLRPAAGSSFCEWKGSAAYLDIISGDRVAERQAWYYPRPTEPFAALRDHVALYPGAVDLCTVDGEPVKPQPGGFYGGWITSRIVGPFKGSPGTSFW